MSHIPQPDTASAPAEVVQDQDANNMTFQASLAQDGGPGAPSREAVIYSGAMNGLDPHLTSHFFPTSQFTWSTTDLPGKLLWSMYIHPSQCNMYLAYLQALYNLWAGGIDINIKVAGTGFHAGAIAIVRIPPNRKASEFTTPASWGAFEYVVIDPKTLEITSFHLIDQRQVLYHYQPFDSSNPNSFGCSVGVYVLQTLNTSSTGANQISLQVFTKAAADFQFAQMVPPYIDSPINPPMQTIINYLNSASPISATTVIPAVTWVSTDNTKKILNSGLQGCYKFNSDPLSQYKDPLAYPYIANSIVTGTTMNLQNLPGNFAGFPYFLSSGGGQLIVYNPVNGQTVIGTIAATPNSDTITLTLPSATPDLNNVHVRFNLFDNKPKLTDTDGNYSLPLNEEGFFLLRDEYLMDTVQTQSFAQACKSGVFKNLIPPGQAILLSFIDTNLQLPLLFVKLYANGIMSVLATATERLFPGDYHFDFFSLILDSDHIPSNPIGAGPAIAMRELRVFQQSLRSDSTKLN